MAIQEVLLYSGESFNRVGVGLLLAGCLMIGLASGAEAACTPVMITSQPGSITVLETCRAVFSAGVSGSAPYTFQWLKNGEAIAGATNSSYTTPPARWVDSGSFYAVTVSNACGQETSRDAFLIISPDVVPPVLVGAVGGPTLNKIVVSFRVGACPDSGATLELFSATDTTNYVVSKGSAAGDKLEVVSAELSCSGTDVILTTIPQTEGVSYTVTVNSVSDLNFNAVPRNSQATFRSQVSTPGFLRFETWPHPPDGLAPATNCADLSAHCLPQSPLYLTAFDTRSVYPDDTHDDYCARVSGFFKPPVSGDWIFYLRGSDPSELFLNPNGSDSSDKVRLIAGTSSFPISSLHASAPQKLVAGNAYYLEGFYATAAGPDYLQVAVKLATDQAEPDGLPTIPGSWLATRADPTGAAIEIIGQPSNVDALIGSAVTFSLTARGSVAGTTKPPIFYQWQRLDPRQAEWTDIAGANQAAYTTSFTSCAESGTQFRCLVALPGAMASSQAASAYVFGDDASPVRLLEQPQSQVLGPGCRATFSVSASGSSASPPTGPAYQWFKNGDAILDATNSSYTTPPVSLGDYGSVFHVVVSNKCGAVTSSDAGLVVVLDVTPPTLLGAGPGPTPDKVELNFSAGPCGWPAGGLEPHAATDPSNYALNGGLVVSNAELSCCGTKVVLTTSRQTDGATYTVTVNGLTDLSGNVIQPNSQATFRANALIRGLLRREIYNYISGNFLSNLTNHASFPYCADPISLVPSFEAPRNVGDQYGQRLSGLILAPVTGDYTFWIASDEQSALFLSTNDSPANKNLIASVQAGVSPRSWDCPSLPECPNASAPISLEAARFYYVEALTKEGTGADHLAVAWQLPGGSPPQPRRDVIPGTYLATYTTPATQLTITQQPLSVTAAPDCKAAFTVGATVQPAGTPVAYQWQRNSQDIPGANSSIYVTDYLALIDNQTVYRCIVRAPGINRTSANAFLHLSEDTTPPQLIGAACYAPTAVLLFFSKPVLPGPAATFSLSGGRLVASNHTDATSRTIIELSVSADTPLTPGTRYLVTVSGVTDLSGNHLSPNPASVSFNAQSALGPAAHRSIRLTPAGRQALVEWTDEGILQAADDPTGPWQDLPDAFSPYAAGATPSPCDGPDIGLRKFYRVRLGSY